MWADVEDADGWAQGRRRARAEPRADADGGRSHGRRRLRAQPKGQMPRADCAARAHLAAEGEDSVRDGAQMITQAVGFRGRTVGALRCKSAAKIVEGGPCLVFLSLAREGLKDFGVEGVLSALGEACVQVVLRWEARSSIGDCVSYSWVASPLEDKTRALFALEAGQPA
ncbi:unnamed protein product [Prorocentrum cordatum]|uniref:Uncharacterized protein n=1 Tax=Prorocentrum cordatum TaxID=2364126 RepID=A0ABN9QA37_9DINO|nr:unnamed protein product [Polarella glacialis]